MNDTVSAIQNQLSRQVEHWSMATARLNDLDNIASPNAWAGLESYLGIAIRHKLKESATKLKWQINK